MSNKVKAIVPAVLILVVVLWGGWLGWRWGVERVYVPHDKALIVVNKFGDPLPADRITVPAGETDKYKGVREEVLGPGRYFLNPIFYDTKLIDVVEIPAGNPAQWRFNDVGQLSNPETAPKIGLLVLKEGPVDPNGREVVDEGTKGIQKKVLTPGVYKVNTERFEVRPEPATIVPPGSVGVVTQLVDDISAIEAVFMQPLSQMTPIAEETPTALPADDGTGQNAGETSAEIALGEMRRGILPTVLQPGIYYLNPRMVKVTVVPVGYDVITLEAPSNPVRFFSDDGYQVEADFTVVWGRDPANTPNIVAKIGNVDQVRDNVVEPAMKAAAQNEGAKYTARELIQGSTRTQFQDELSAALDEQVSGRDLHVLLALIRNISIKDTRTGEDATQGLLATIQRANIEIERELTNQQKTLTAEVRAALEEAKKQVDIAREEIASQTRVKTANIDAEAAKRAAEIDAERERDVAVIEAQIAMLEADRERKIGEAEAQVVRMRNDAEAQGAKLLIDAFGSAQAYNQYIFAKNFKPEDLRLIFAGPGTFWTDLKTFEQVGASRVMQQSENAPSSSAVASPER
ncbi:MAG: SPFH domain-containing protein [Phycisphaerae bacterium]